MIECDEDEWEEEDMPQVLLVMAVLSAALTVVFLARGLWRAVRVGATTRRATSLIIGTSIVTGVLMLYELATALGALLRS